MMKDTSTVESSINTSIERSTNDVLHALNSIEKNNEYYHAIREVTSHDPNQQGGKSLSDVTVVIKDNIHVDGFKTFAGLKRPLPEGCIEEGDIVQRIKKQDGYIVGKAYCAELCIGGTGLNLAQGTPRNPYGNDDHLSPGGSSSGVAVAVATDMAKIGIGTDSGGSIRVPASVCGLAGYRPSENIFVNDGYLGLGNTDRIGVIAKTLGEIKSFSNLLSDVEIKPISSNSPKIKYMSLDLVKELSSDHLKLYLSRIDSLKNEYNDISPIDVGYIQDLKQNLEHIHYGKLAGFELARLVDQIIPEYEVDLDPRLQRLVKKGREVTHDEVKNIHHQLSKLAMNKMMQLFSETDYLITPSLPISAPSVGMLEDDNVYEIVSEAMLKFTMLGTFLQGPCITIPNGLDNNGIPVGLQVIGRPGIDQELLTQDWGYGSL